MGGRKLPLSRCLSSLTRHPSTVFPYRGSMFRRLRVRDGGLPARTLAVMVIVLLALGSAPILIPMVGWLIGLLR